MDVDCREGEVVEAEGLALLGSFGADCHFFPLSNSSNLDLAVGT
jgi:hypothetical protein